MLEQINTTSATLQNIGMDWDMAYYHNIAEKPKGTVIFTSKLLNHCRIPHV